MAEEIELRFLLRGPVNVPSVPDGYEVDYTHGYLPGTLIRERVSARSIAPTYKRTMKFGTGMSREEIEEPIDEAFFQKLWPLTEGQRIVAHRWAVPDMELHERWKLLQIVGEWRPHRVLRWEISSFKCRDLWMVELELPWWPVKGVSTDFPVFPSWLAPHVVREVTQDARYEACNLAQIEGVPS